MLGVIRGRTWSPVSMSRLRGSQNVRCPGECPGVQMAWMSQPGTSGLSPSSKRTSGFTSDTNARTGIDAWVSPSTSSGGAPQRLSVALTRASSASGWS